MATQEMSLLRSIPSSTVKYLQASIISAVLIYANVGCCHRQAEFQAGADFQAASYSHSMRCQSSTHTLLVTQQHTTIWLASHTRQSMSVHFDIKLVHFDIKCYIVQGPTTALSEPYLNDITMFDVNTHTWHTPDVHGARPPVRDSHAAVALGNRMVIYGGDCGKEYLGDVWAYHVEQQKWQAFKVGSLCPEESSYAPCTS